MNITTPLNLKLLSRISAGNIVYITGTVYTARDAAHKKIYDSIKARKPIPIPLTNQIIYYTGPTPAKPGRIIGSAGPTSSCRMDKYTPLLVSKGVKIMIGKGPRSAEVIDAMKKNKAVYLAAFGGAGALLSKCITKCELAAYPELGTEAVYKLEVKDFPAIVINDIKGNDLYKKIRHENNHSKEDKNGQKVKIINNTAEETEDGEI